MSLALDDDGDHRDALACPSISVHEQAASGIEITQIVASVHLWGQRSKYYPKYLEAVTDHGLTPRQVVAAHESWDQHRPMNAAQFQANVSRRLLPELHKAVEDVLSEADRQTLNDLGAAKVLCAYFIMPTPGRVAFHGTPVPTLRLMRSGHTVSEGLTLYFDTRLTPFHRCLLDGTIFGVLGKDTDCRIVQFEERGTTAVVRLTANRRADLDAVAEALYLRVWEAQKAHSLMRLASALQGDAIRECLSEIRRHLDRMTLSLEAIPTPKGDGGEHVGARAATQAWSWNMKTDRVQLPRPFRVFIGYTSKDREYSEQLETHLSQLRRNGFIATWTERAIAPGMERDREICAALQEADLYIFLVSPDFLASDSIDDIQVKVALERQASGRAGIVPVLVRPADWELSRLSRFEVLPPGAKPITKWQDRDEAWLEVAHGVRRVIMGMAATSAACYQLMMSAGER
jgi:TIR domain